MNHSRLLSFLSVALLVSCAGSMVYTMDEQEALLKKNHKELLKKLNDSQEEVKEKQEKILEQSQQIANNTRKIFASNLLVLTESLDLAGQQIFDKENSTVYELIRNLRNASRANELHSVALTFYDGRGSGAEYTFISDDIDNAVLNAGLDSAAFIGTHFTLQQIGKIGALKELANTVGYDNLPDFVQTALEESILFFSAHSLPIGIKMALTNRRKSTLPTN